MPFIDDGFEALLEPFYNGKKLTDPISTVEDKNQLLPAFLKVKGTCKIERLFQVHRVLTFNDRFGQAVSNTHASRYSIP